MVRNYQDANCIFKYIFVSFIRPIIFSTLLFSIGVIPKVSETCNLIDVINMPISSINRLIK